VGAIAAIALALLVLVLAAGTAEAKTFTVNSLVHPGDGVCNATPCTPAEANGNLQGDTIGFASGLKGEIPLHNTTSQGGFSIYDDATGPDLTINGPGAGVLAVDGNDETRPFGIAFPAHVTIRGSRSRTARPTLQIPTPVASAIAALSRSIT
jgi:hypothetical protein